MADLMNDVDRDLELALKLSLELQNDDFSSTRELSALEERPGNVFSHIHENRELSCISNEYNHSPKDSVVLKKDEDFQLALTLSKEINQSSSPQPYNDGLFQNAYFSSEFEPKQERKNITGDSNQNRKRFLESDNKNQPPKKFSVMDEDDFELALQLSKEINSSSSSSKQNFHDNLLISESSQKTFQTDSVNFDDNENEDFLLAIKLSMEESDQHDVDKLGSSSHSNSKALETSFNENDDYLLALKLSAENNPQNVTVDEDFLLAMEFSEDFVPDTEPKKPSASKKFDSNSSKSLEAEPLRNYEDNSLSVVDPIWETIDPNPDIYALFAAFNKRFFWGKLDCVEVKWSPRMTLCAGICSYSSRAGFCSVRLSKPLLQLRPRKDLVETLLHEMIHAFLFVTKNDRDRDGHGPRFHSHMYRINKASGAHITVYHSFHAEVKHYKTHWWKCNGPCQHRAPYYGYVKRSTNRAPGPYDRWWNDHRATCNGEFIKVKEPENYNKQSKKNTVKEKVNSLNNYYTSSSNSSTAASNVSAASDVFKNGKFQNSFVSPTTSNTATNSSSRSKQILTLVDLNSTKNRSKSVMKSSDKNIKSPEKSRWAPLPGQKTIFQFLNKS